MSRHLRADELPAYPGVALDDEWRHRLPSERELAEVTRRFRARAAWVALLATARAGYRDALSGVDKPAEPRAAYRLGHDWGVELLDGQVAGVQEDVA